MKVILRFKAPPASRRKDVVIEAYEGPALPLAALKALWEAEVAINTHTSLRVHLEVEAE